MTPRTTGTGTTLSLVPQVDGAAHAELVGVRRRHAMTLLIASRSITMGRTDRAMLMADLRALLAELGRETPRCALVAVLMDLVHDALVRCDDLPLPVRNVLATWSGVGLDDDVSPSA